jgi:hypothetical protein
MTERSDTQREPGAEATPDSEPQVRSEVIQDLAVTDDDADNIAAGNCRFSSPC